MTALQIKEALADRGRDEQSTVVAQRALRSAQDDSRRRILRLDKRLKAILSSRLARRT